MYTLHILRTIGLFGHIGVLVNRARDPHSSCVRGIFAIMLLVHQNLRNQLYNTRSQGRHCTRGGSGDCERRPTRVRLCFPLGVFSRSFYRLAYASLYRVWCSMFCRSVCSAKIKYSLEEDLSALPFLALVALSTVKTDTRL